MKYFKIEDDISWPALIIMVLASILVLIIAYGMLNFADRERKKEDVKLEILLGEKIVLYKDTLEIIAFENNFFGQNEYVLENGIKLREDLTISRIIRKPLLDTNHVAKKVNLNGLFKHYFGKEKND